MENQQNFYQEVYDLVVLILRGRVTTYGAIAKALGSARSSRMVGTALIAANLPMRKLPIHRVVNRNGLLTGKHHYGTPSMQELLEADGVEVIDDQVQNFSAVFWDPLKEL